MIAGSLAVLTAGHGFETLVFARNECSAARCGEAMDGFFAQMEAHGCLTAAQRAACRGRIRFVYDYADLSGAEAAFESVVEDAGVKYALPAPGGHLLRQLLHRARRAGGGGGQIR